jgi:hypothetical protein
LQLERRQLRRVAPDLRYIGAESHVREQSMCIPAPAYPRNEDVPVAAVNVFPILSELSIAECVADTRRFSQRERQALTGHLAFHWEDTLAHFGLGASEAPASQDPAMDLDSTTVAGPHLGKRKQVPWSNLP